MRDAGRVLARFPALPRLGSKEFRELLISRRFGVNPGLTLCTVAGVRLKLTVSNGRGTTTGAADDGSLIVMDEAARLSALIGDIYDAALAPALWTAVVEKAGRFAGGSGASIFSRDSVRLTGNAYYHFGVDPQYERLYFEKYIKFDPLNAAYLTLAVGEVMSNSKIVAHAEFIESRFYQEWARPQGWVDVIHAALERSPTSIAGFVVFRHERDGIADDNAHRRLRLLAPHLRRAVLIGKVIDLKVIEAATFADALDGLSAGMFLVDASAHLVHANTAGHALLAAGDFLRLMGGRLTAGDPQIDQGLRDVLIAAGDGDAAVGIKGIALPLIAHDGERHFAHVLPLTSGARRRAGIATSAAAALFVHKAAPDVPSPPEAIARAYKLTPTELRVLLAIFEIGGAPEVAEALGIGDTTVRTHLARLFEKTGAKRQADLVKLVAGFSSPLHG
jgi:DNA-binding CsgD family transcriptional regulator